jgi:hypothetical protein
MIAILALAMLGIMLAVGVLLVGIHRALNGK